MEALILYKIYIQLNLIVYWTEKFDLNNIFGSVPTLDSKLFNSMWLHWSKIYFWIATIFFAEKTEYLDSRTGILLTWLGWLLGLIKKCK